MTVFVYFFIYETKGLTLEEVDEMYEQVKHARHSTKWVPPPQHSLANDKSDEEKQRVMIEERESS